MAAEIKLTKNDDSPWGFRLTGGRDFGTPLTIIKVGVGSVAEEAGLQVGDILVKINDADCHPFTHKEAQDIILDSENTIAFSVLRGSLSLPEAVIDRLTPLPLRDFKTPERNIPSRSEPSRPKEIEAEPVPEPSIEVIPVKDLEPELLEELGLNPLPEDFLEKAKRDPSPLPEVRPQSRMASAPDILETLEEMGLQEVVQDIERQKETVFASEPAVEAAPLGETPVEVEGSQQTAEVASAAEGSVESQLPVVALAATTEGSTDLPPSISNDGPVQPISEEEFAEFMSGKEEVLEVGEKNALGVDFTKFEPKADFLKKSQVFRSLQDSEKLITSAEKDKRWTTFLDKPRGPKPKPRPKPKPQFAEISSEPAPTTEPERPESRKGLYEFPPEEEFEALVRVPTPAEPPPVVSPQEDEQQTTAEGTETEKPDSEPSEDVQQQLKEEQENLQQQLEVEKQLNAEKFGEEKSEIELQLEEIQRQLQAIQQLPYEIQQHLALVQQQLNNIVQNRAHDQEDGIEIPPCPRPSMVDPSVLIDSLDQIEGHQILAPVEETNQETEEPAEQEISIDLPAEKTEEPTEQSEIPAEEKKEFKLRTEEDSPILPPPKKERPKKKRPFLGLGPAPRPLVLPGGRRWRTPKDAYNDEFIAETLSAQAEIITGSTLGVNFLRYEPKHPSLVHLRDSTVYKMIHDLEDPDVVNKGLASRPEIVPALQDYSQQSAPAAI